MIREVIGTTVGSYRILSKVSTGGMGTVYRAEHTLIGKAAAVKVLNAELCTNEDVVNRFLNEAKATTTIKHPGIVEVFDYGYMESGHAYLVMEFLEGMTLAKRCKVRGKIPEGEAAMLLRGVCSALSAAHAKGIIHRDLKPDNVFLAEDPDAPTGERAKLLDFGIAKLTEIGLAGATKEGAVMGTPTYMSPEQCRGTGEVDLRADLYSIGCMYYELVTGRPPFVGLGAGELIGAHLFVDPDPPTMHAPELSTETAQLIMSLIEKDPDDRPQTTRELAVQLTLIAQHQGWVTQTNPTGISSPSLPILRPPPPLPTELDSKPRPSPRAATELPDKPTTLSGAASSIIDVPRRSRRGIAIALAATAFLASATVAFIQLRKSGDDPASTTPATTPTPAVAPTPTPRPPVEAAKPVEPPKPAVVVETEKRVETAKPVEPPPKPAITTVKPTNPVQKPAKLPVKPTKPPVKPTKPTLIETEL